MNEVPADTRFWNSQERVTEFAGRPPVEYRRNLLLNVSRRETLRALDLGSGGGRNTQLLVELGFRAYACDLNSGMACTTRHRIVSQFGENRANIVQGNMAALPLRSEIMDIILSNGVIHNATTKQELGNTFDEIQRVTKRGGLLLLSMFTSDSIDTKSLKPDPQHPVYRTNEDLKMVLHSTPELLEMLKERSFRVVGEVQQYGCTLDIGDRAIMRTVLQKD